MHCPNCGSEDILLITYGQPPVSGSKLRQMLDEKTLVLGGCINCEEETPAYYCRSCEHRFGDARTLRKPKFRIFRKNKEA